MEKWIKDIITAIKDFVFEIIVAVAPELASYLEEKEEA